MLRRIIIVCLLFATVGANAQQKVIQMYNGAAPGSANWTYNEQEINAGTQNDLVYNVSKPTLTVFPADATKANGTAVIVCPGGGFFILSYAS